MAMEGWMTTYTRISADSHIDMPWMPNDLFTLNASAALKDRMPYVADGPDGPYWTCKNGMSFGLVCGVGPGGAKYVPASVRAALPGGSSEPDTIAANVSRMWCLAFSATSAGSARSFAA